MLCIEFLVMPPPPTASAFHLRQGLCHCHTGASAAIGGHVCTATGKTEGGEGKADSAAEREGTGESGLVS